MANKSPQHIHLAPNILINALNRLGFRLDSWAKETSDFHFLKSK